MLKTSIIVPLMNETYSLQQTVDIVMTENKNDIFEIIIVVAKRTSTESMGIAQELINKYPDHIRILEQTLPFLGGAMRDAFESVRGSHVIMMASDMETDPHTVKALIATAAARPDIDIIATSRWLTGGGFKGYKTYKAALNFIFQKTFSLLYGTHLTDLTFGFRLYKTEWLKKFIWTELRHPFLFECLIKPLRTGAKIIEIPSPWKSRFEGVSQNNLKIMASYTITGLRLRFMPINNFIKK